MAISGALKTIQRTLLFLLVASFLLSARLVAAVAPNLDQFLYYEHPEIAAAIVWEFSEEEYQPIPEIRDVSSIPHWMGKVGKVMAATGIDARGNSVSASNPVDGQGISEPVPIPTDFQPGGGRSLQWYYWSPTAKAKLNAYYQYYYQWLTQAWPLYKSYRDSGFQNKPPGFAEKFEGPDADIQAGEDLLPIVFSVMKNNYPHVLYDSNAAFEMYLKGVAMQLALEAGDFLPWKMAGDSLEDRAQLLDGRWMFRYFPAGSHPWGGTQTATQGGHDAVGLLPAPPIFTLKFLVKKGALRETRFETVSQWLEWERNLYHTMGDPQSHTGVCGKSFHEVLWGVKGAVPASKVLIGTAMACEMVPAPGSNSTLSYNDTEIKNRTGGCGMTGFLHHRILRLVNLPTEASAASIAHGKSRFVVERAPFRQMLSELQPNLPFEPNFDDGLLQVPQHAVKKLPFASSPATIASPLRGGKGGAFENAYLDHNDAPYSLRTYLEIPERELLIPEETFRRLYSPAPANLSEEQGQQYSEAHGKYVDLRSRQLAIYYLPLRLLQNYCTFDQGKPYEETKLFETFERKYSFAQLEEMGFWTRFEQKLASLGGCEALPPAVGY